MKRFVRVLAVVAMAGALSGCGINAIPTAEENAKAKAADLEAQYQRRADLVPNLVATVQGFAAQERQVLTEVTEARARATSVTLDPATLSDPAALQRFQEAQSQLSGALGRLLLVQERYPELRSSENFLALQSQLEGTENRIAVARRDYNEAVRQFNTLRRTFPTVVWANTLYAGSEALAPFEAAPGAETAPTVSFEQPQPAQ
jgi:LemA protein